MSSKKLLLKYSLLISKTIKTRYKVSKTIKD